MTDTSQYPIVFVFMLMDYNKIINIHLVVKPIHFISVVMYKHFPNYIAQFINVYLMITDEF